MRSTTELIVKKYALLRLKYDFMGYKINNPEDLSFHHLIVPSYLCKGDRNNGYVEWNGVVLNQNTSHSYLHTIEFYDFDRFAAITSEMIDEIAQGYIDYYSIARINDILNSFEKEYIDKKNKKGTLIIKKEYLRRILKKQVNLN